MDLFDEMRALLTELEERSVEYALAGAVALAIHGVTRATTDIDLLVPAESAELVLEVARGLGFDLPAMPMAFSDGMTVRRVTKIEGEESLTLDLLLVDDNLKPVWDDRITVEADFGPVRVVSRDGLIQMKSWAGRDQDLADIQRLREIDR